MASTEKTLDQLLQLSVRPARANRADAIARALRTANLLLDADAAVAVLASAKGDGDRLALYAGSDVPAALPSILATSEAARALAAEPKALVVPDLSDHATFATTDACPGVESGPVLFLPVEQGGGLPAHLAIYRKRGRARYTTHETELMLLLAAWLGASLENLKLAGGAERLALTDDATQVYNARFVRAALQREIRRAERHGQELSLVRIELDRVDAFRETHGKAATARLLKGAAAVLARQVRSFDVLGKDGDHGFMALLPQTGREGAHEVAERMRAAIVEWSTAQSEVGGMTATFGVAGFPHDGVEREALLHVAERGLEHGRHRGGNCVTGSTRKAA